MIKVLIVDDEPYIRQGLNIIIDWEKYGFEICGEASNGVEAIMRLENEKFDLVITDIKMPQMNGIELIERTWERISKDVKFIILSGFYEFEYAKKAIKYNVVDYVLKPVQTDELIRVLEEYKRDHQQYVEELIRKQYFEKVLFDRHLFNLIEQKYERESYDYVKRYLSDLSLIRFICIELDFGEELNKEVTKEDKIKAKRELYEVLKDFMGTYWYQILNDLDKEHIEYGLGLIFTKNLIDEIKIEEDAYIHRLQEFLNQRIPYRNVLYIGQRIEDLEQIAKAYKTAIIARNFHRFSKEKSIIYYEDINNIKSTKYGVEKEIMDVLIRAIKEYEMDLIDQCIDQIYDAFRVYVTEPEIIKINLDYLLFNLLNLVKELNPDANKEEILNKLNPKSFEQIALRGSVVEFKSYIYEFADHLIQIRQHALGGLLKEIEKEIEENYMDNISLKSLSEKYFINSAYLGQVFKKHYGIGFKDYLNTYRIERAAELLIGTKEKIYLIAQTVGYNNTDYFISKFVQIKGITPLQYRKNLINKAKSKLS